MKDKKLVLFLVVFGIFFLPLVSLAGTYIASSTIATTTVTYDGLVPCGKIVDIGGGATTTIACQFCHFFVMLDAILDFVILNLIFPIAVLMLVIGGLMYVGAIFELMPGGFQTLTQAKQIFSSVAIGLLIILSAWLLINLFFQLIGVASWTGLTQNWWRINCPITY